MIDDCTHCYTSIDILDVKTTRLRGTSDGELLELAVEQDRILITHDRHTMTRYFRDRVAGLPPNRNNGNGYVLLYPLDVAAETTMSPIAHCPMPPSLPDAA